MVAQKARVRSRRSPIACDHPIKAFSIDLGRDEAAALAYWEWRRWRLREALGRCRVCRAAAFDILPAEYVPWIGGEEVGPDVWAPDGWDADFAMENRRLFDAIQHAERSLIHTEQRYFSTLRKAEKLALVRSWRVWLERFRVASALPKPASWVVAITLTSLHLEVDGISVDRGQVDKSVAETARLRGSVVRGLLDYTHALLATEPSIWLSPRMRLYPRPETVGDGEPESGPSSSGGGQSDRGSEAGGDASTDGSSDSPKSPLSDRVDGRSDFDPSASADRERESLSAPAASTSIAKSTPPSETKNDKGPEGTKQPPVRQKVPEGA